MHFKYLFPLPFWLATLALAEPLTPESASRLALEKNPDLLAARAIVAEAEARASGLGRLPNPELDTEFAAGSRERGRIEIGLSQRFPRSSRLRLERAVAAESIALARLEIAAREAEVLGHAQEAVIELAAAREGLALAARQADLAREFANAQTAQATQGQLSSLDAAQARLAVQEILLGDASLHIEESAAAAKLATLLGLDAGSEIAVEADLSLPPELPTPPAAAQRADLAFAERGLAAGDAETALARAAAKEDLSLGLFVEGEQDRGEFGERERELKVGLRFSVPLPVRNVSAPAVAEKQAARRRLALERDALALSVQNDLAAATAAVRVRHAAAQALAAELLPAARRHLDDTAAAYARGEADMAQVFRARERLAEIERADLDARHAYHLARIRHLAALGRLHDPR